MQPELRGTLDDGNPLATAKNIEKLINKLRGVNEIVISYGPANITAVIKENKSYASTEKQLNIIRIGY